jgi:hypothetical protein
VLVQVTSADAAAFAETWAGLKPVNVTPEALAGYWAALIQDQLTLFVVHQRPLRLLELTPRAQALLDLWSSAVRLGHGPDGIPAALVWPVPDHLARGLRDLAFSPGSGAKGGGSAQIALAGTWTGTMTDGGITKSIRVRLQLAGKGLQGSLSSQSGMVSMDLPMRDLSYTGGQLKFKILTGGSPRTFTGAFDGRQIAGTIAGPSGPAGNFRIELME